MSPRKAERSIFVTLSSKIKFIFISSDKTLSSEKMKKSLNWLSSFDYIVISQNIVIVNFLFILVTVQSGIMALFYFHTLIRANY